MKRLILVMSMVLVAALSAGGHAEAARLGGGGSSGMKRMAPAAAPKPPAQAAPAPAQNAAPAAPAAVPPTAAAAPKRSWMGPLAGLAAGLGLAALASHFGFGAELANVMSIMLVVMLGAVLLGFAMKYFAKRRAPAFAGAQGMQFANVGSGHASEPVQMPYGVAASGTSSIGAAEAAAPAGFDSGEFETIAKRVFIRLQAANDAGDLDDLRRFTTPEMFAVAKQALLDRGTTPQQTDVVQLQAAVIETAQEAGNQIVSVRFSGLIREERESPALPFDEVWHLLRPLDGSREWAIAGIQQTS